FFYRNIRAREQLEIFLLSAIGSVLAIRFYLHVTGYPQIGAGGLHIAHILYGGLFMAAAAILSMSFLGLKVQRLAALIGGVGFGFFIDEIGKFITSDNDYFFRPAIGMIYAIFVILYLTFNFLSRDQRLSSREYQLNALVQLEEAIVHDMDPTEKERALKLLLKADHRSPVTRQLQALVENVDLVPQDQPRNITRLLNWLDQKYTDFWSRRSSHPLIRIFFVLETILFVVIVSWGIFNNIDEIKHLFTTGTAPYDFWLLMGQVASSAVAACYAIVGAYLLTRSRERAFEQFRRATLINLFMTEFFIFSRVEFQALPGFLFNVAVLLFISYVIHQERRVHNKHSSRLAI
ncbi:MAG: putative rane protein, partial [Candidatus Saccharibacteria bacterium]|nr:putative rane protein [Candidatus Saccharibacteria bacterium]